MTDQKLTRDNAVSTDTAVMRALKKIRVPATQRNRELGLLLFAIVVYGAALVLVQLGVNGAVESGFLTLASVPAVLALILHVVLRLRARDADPFVLPIATVLPGIGIAMIYRIDLAVRLEGWDATSNRQIAWAAIALVAALAVVLFVRNYRVLFRYTYLSGLIGILLLLLPFVPGLGTEQNADVWVSLLSLIHI